MLGGGSSCREVHCTARGLKTMPGIDGMPAVEQLDAGREYLARVFGRMQPVM
jgi:hypothetical protein